MELAILLPVGILVLALIVVGARIALAGDRISGVAGDRRPRRVHRPLTRPGAEHRDDQREPRLSTDDLHCTNIRVNVDTSGFDALPGTGASITVNVWCTVDLSDIGVAGMPGSKTLHDVATSPLDPARDVGHARNAGPFRRIPPRADGRRSPPHDSGAASTRSISAADGGAR